MADGVRVLVVDDEPNITELLAMALRHDGFAVETAASGRAARAAVDEFRPALIVLDVMLPDLEGFEVVRRLSAAGRRVPITFLTARDATEDKVHGLTVGGDDYVTKALQPRGAARAGSRRPAASRRGGPPGQPPPPGGPGDRR